MIYIQAIAVIATVIIGGASIWVNFKSIQTNKDIAKENREILKENAGKNRIIYGVEVMSADDKNNLKIKLDSGNYTILNAYANPGSFSNTIVVLGKINP